MLRMMSTRIARRSHDWEMVDEIGESGMGAFGAIRCTGEGARATLCGILHDWRHGDAHHCERANQFTPNYRDRGQQKLFSLFIRLAQDGMAVIKRVEKLR